MSRPAQLNEYLSPSLRLRHGYDLCRLAFKAFRWWRSLARDERDRLLNTLRTLSNAPRPLPPALAGRQLCFLHIGKTAGTSLQHSLFEALSGAAIFHESLPGFDRVSAAELALNDLVIGHFNYQHVGKMRPDRFLMTFLRDPIDRVVSSYHFLRTKSPLSLYSQAAWRAARSMSFEEFLLCEDPNVRMVSENSQTKALAYDIRADRLDPAMIDVLLETAERNLATFDFVGITEYFDDSVGVLSEMLGVEISPKQLNINPDRPAAPPSGEELAIARSMNELDLALYAKARARFEQLYLGRGLSPM